MSESNESVSPGVDSRDYESEFYTLLGGQNHQWPRVEDVERDFFDGTLGDQSGLMGDGNVGVLLAMSQRGAVLLAGAFDHWVNHGCQEAIQLAMYLLQRVGEQLKPVLSELPDVAGYEPFNH